MDRIEHFLNSEVLKKEMNIAVYGHYGFALLLFPATSDDYLEYENNGLIETIKQFIEKGKCTVFSIAGANFESWLNGELSPEEKSQRHYEYNQFIIEEVLPFVFGTCGGPVPVITCGAGIGAFHAANHYFRRPDIFYGMIAMSGTYNIMHFTGGYFDENCYFNSPVHYLPNLHDEYWLSFLRNKHHVYMMTGTGENEHPANLDNIVSILNMKEIPHHHDYWGNEWGHNWVTWKAMLNHILETSL